MTPSLRTRLTLPIVAAFISLGAVALWFIDQRIQERLVADFDAALTERLTGLVALIGFDPPDEEEGEDEPFVEFDYDEEMFPGYLKGASPAYFQVWLPEDVVRSASLGEGDLRRGVESFGIVDVTLPDGRAGRLAFSTFKPRFDEDWGASVQRAANFHAEYPGQDRPDVSVAVAVSREPLDDTLLFIRALLSTSFLGLMLLISVIAWLFVGQGLKPLTGLVSRLSQVNSERLDERLPEQSLPAEVAPLAVTINALLERLQRSFEKERLFSRNVAHELRTPIAELQSIGEVGAMWPDDPEANARFFKDIARVSQRMDLMVTNLLMMARQENGQIECTWETVDLVNELRKVRERYQDDCDEAGAEIRVDAPPSLPIVADRVYLDIVLSNIVSNAINHGANGVIKAAIRSDSESQASIDIENEADDLEREDLEHVFDRFWRKDRARTGGRHVGLGLPLVKSLTELCGWDVQTELADEKTFRISVTGMTRVATTAEAHVVAT